MSHYLITGAAGFIGSKVTEILLAEGHTVVGVDNMNEAYDPRLKQWRLAQLTPHPTFRFYPIDVCDKPALEKLFAEKPAFDAVINLAARAGVRYSVDNPWVYFETNTTGTLNLLELCNQHQIKKFVLASTSSLYGQHNPMPFQEDADTSRPLSPYAASKKAAEVLCYSYHYLYQIDVTIFRYFTVYGPAGRPDMSMFRFVQWISEGKPVEIFGDGQQSRDFTYVDDIARGTIAGLKPMGYEIINLGSDRPINLMEIIRTVEQKVGRPAKLEFKPRHPADVRDTWANISRAGEKLGWEPMTHYEQGIENLVAWYNANRAWASEIHT
ncbi:MAG: SDR family NAD(P)-dependent oxidoreductase [Anaerolineae bacterium]|nr:SDR family NAD(P)-dependent oxidoreductase [Anaerolineae bacterium]